MLLWSPQVDKYIIYEYHHELFQAGFKDPIHEIHECFQGISEPKGHHYELIVSVLGIKGSPRYVFVLNSELVVP